MPFFKKNKGGHSFIIVLVFFFVFLIWLNPGFLYLLESRTLDFRFWVRGVIPTDGRVVIVSVDEKSIRELGRWPFSRKRIADVTLQIASGGPKVIAFDILFSEEENAPPDTQVVNQVVPKPLIENGLSGDAAFQSALKKVPNTILPVAFEVQESYTKKAKELQGDLPGYLQNFSFARIRQSGKVMDAIEAIGVLPPLPVFAEAASALGHVYTLPDRDGVLRYELLSLKYGGDYYPALGLQVARTYLGVDPLDMELVIGEGIRLGRIFLPTDEWGRMLINYHGREGTFPYYSITDVVHGRVPSSLFRNKIVLIGTSALATFDLKVTPFSNNMPGVEKNANVIDGIISQNFLHRSEKMKGVDVIFLLLYGTILWLFLPRLHAVGGALLALSLLLFHGILMVFVFIYFGYWFYMTYSIFEIGAIYVGFTAIQFFTEEKKAQEIEKMFSSYVTPRVLEEMMEHPELTQLGGVRQKVTILFSDVRGFTGFCERHAPSDVLDILNQFLTEMTDVIFKWEGTLDKFMGDAVMVFWGAPLPQADHARRAIGCALEMRTRLGLLQKKWVAEGRELLEVGIGINSGDVIVGNIGAAGKKMDYTVIGDSVNLAARLESLTRTYAVNIVTTEETRKQFLEMSDPDQEGAVLFRLLDQVKVKGKEQPVVIYEVVTNSPSHKPSA